MPFAVIGAGSIGMRHIEVAQASDCTDLVAVVEQHEPTRAYLTAQGLPVVASIDELPAETRAAVIATPTPDHCNSALACMTKGIAVLLEKPISATLDESYILLAESARSGLPLLVGHHRRCHPFSIAARDALTQIGDIVGVQGLWSLRKHNSYYEAEWRRKPGAGPLMTNLSHEIDLMRFLLGELTEVSALLSSARRGFEIEDTAALAFRFENGALGSFLISDAGASPWSFEAASHENPAIAGSSEDYLRITGTEGAIAFPSLTFWGRSDEGEIEWSKPLRRNPGPRFEPIDPLLAQLERFAGVVGGAQDDVLCSGLDGLKALEMTLATALSGRTGMPVRAGAVPGDFRGV